MTKEQTDEYLDKLRTVLWRAEAITQSIDNILFEQDEGQQSEIDCTCLAESVLDYIDQASKILDEIEFIKVDECKEVESKAQG